MHNVCNNHALNCWRSEGHSWVGPHGPRHHHRWLDTVDGDHLAEYRFLHETSENPAPMLVEAHWTWLYRLSRWAREASGCVHIWYGLDIASRCRGVGRLSWVGGLDLLSWCSRHLLYRRRPTLPWTDECAVNQAQTNRVSNIQSYPWWKPRRDWSWCMNKQRQTKQNTRNSSCSRNSWGYHLDSSWDGRLHMLTWWGAIGPVWSLSLRGGLRLWSFGSWRSRWFLWCHRDGSFQTTKKCIEIYK